MFDRLVIPNAIRQLVFDDFVCPDHIKWEDRANVWVLTPHKFIGMAMVISWTGDNHPCVGTGVGFTIVDRRYNHKSSIDYADPQCDSIILELINEWCESIREALLDKERVEYYNLT